jgi:hypothetical protein
MNSMNLIVAPYVQYSNQTYDVAISEASNYQLLIKEIKAKNGSAAANDICLGHAFNSNEQTAGASGNNYVIQCKEKFGMAALYLTTADTSGVTFTYEYYNGSSWASLTLQNTPSLVSTGKKAILFNSPQDWGLDGSSYYAIRIVASGTPNYVIAGVKCCGVLSYQKNVYPGGEAEICFESRPLLLQGGEGIVPFFLYSDTSNSIKAVYQINP